MPSQGQSRSSPRSLKFRQAIYKVTGWKKNVEEKDIKSSYVLVDANRKF